MLPSGASPAFFSASLIGLVWSERFQRLPWLRTNSTSSGERLVARLLKESAALVCNMIVRVPVLPTFTRRVLVRASKCEIRASANSPYRAPAVSYTHLRAHET